MSAAPHVPLGHVELDPATMRARARTFFETMRTRRSVRAFAERPVPEGVLEDCLRAAGSAPSGANRQPWHFVVVRDPEVKRRIRAAAEAEERAFYERRAPAEWLAALAPLGTGPDKPFLEAAPALVAIFAERWREDGAKRRHPNYYVDESVGIATGLLVAAIHHAGLVCLTHTPSPMGFLSGILERPPGERAFLLLVVGYPAPGARVPALERKPLGAFATFVG